MKDCNPHPGFGVQKTKHLLYNFQNIIGGSLSKFDKFRKIPFKCNTNNIKSNNSFKDGSLVTSTPNYQDF